MSIDRPTPYVLSWRLADRKVVVVGGGSIGTAKVELLLATGARIVVVDPTPSDRVVELAGADRVTLRRRRARFVDLIGARLLVAATGCTTTNRRLRRMARVCGAVVNAVDDQANCDVTVPAIIRRGPATIAITTDGSTPAGARFLREEVTAVVDQALPEGIGEVLTGAAQAREDLRASGRYTYDYYRWRNRYFTPALAVVADGGDLGPLRRRFVERFAHPDPVPQLGRVTLVGAGPGGADLITVRGAKALAAADVVVYDRLADPELLDLAPPAAERIPVGKGKGHGATQGAINALLVERAVAGANVVRLKGGDPFVFGRGQEEVDAATDAGVPVEVVPGVSSAVAAPALAGIPLTDRRVAASFTVLTGHRATTDGSPDPDWVAASAGSGTVVVLMAATSAAGVAASLVAGGRSDDLPVAFVHAAGTEAQQSCRSTLGRVVAAGCPFPAPTVMVVGEVVSLAADRPVELRSVGSHQSAVVDPVVLPMAR
ncbi:MAG: uroporphyrinogen-III C-methyltransferase [Actinomycetota bacterium]